MAVVIGIDFGTCFSSVYFIHGNDYMQLSPKEEQSRVGLIPSAFYHDDKNEFLGSKALKMGRVKPQCLSEYIKRQYRKSEILLGGSSFTPRQIVNNIITYLMEGVKYSLREQYRNNDDDISAVITVPVTYGEQWKSMLREAVESAGIKVKAMIPEPVAAAVYFMEENFRKTVLVYDLGGGTTDITLLQATGNSANPYKVLAQDGDDIGGNDWDERVLILLEHQISEILTERGADDNQQQRFLERNRRNLLQCAREIKEALTEEEHYTTMYEERGETFDLTVTRAEFEEITRSLLDETMQVMHRTISGQTAFEDIILVGGGSHMPQVIARMKQEFPECTIKITNPEFAVAMGAARYAQMQQSISVPVMMKSTHSYGIVFQENDTQKIRNLIFKDENLPILRLHEWPMTGPYVHFMVYEGECSDTTQPVVPVNNGQYVLSATVWFRNQPLPDAKCSTVLELDSSGMLRISLLDQDSLQISDATVSVANHH